MPTCGQGVECSCLVYTLLWFGENAMAKMTRSNRLEHIQGEPHRLCRRGALGACPGRAVSTFELALVGCPDDLPSQLFSAGVVVCQR